MSAEDKAGEKRKVPKSRASSFQRASHHCLGSPPRAAANRGIQLGRQLGQGAFGVVRLARLAVVRRYVAEVSRPILQPRQHSPDGAPLMSFARTRTRSSFHVQKTELPANVLKCPHAGNLPPGAQCATCNSNSSSNISAAAPSTAQGSSSSSSSGKVPDGYTFLEIAVKRISKRQAVTSGQAEHVLAERRILESLIGQPFCVQSLGAWATANHLYLAMERCYGELYERLQSVGRFDRGTTAFYVAQVALVFASLHARKVVYRDLKPENILFDATGYLKVADYGLAKVVEWKTFTLCGTPEYLAPEVLQTRGYNRSADWWGVGVLIYELLAGEAPFTAENPLDIYNRILRGDLRFPAHFDEASKSIIRHLLVADVTQRYGCLRAGPKDVLEHRFFSQAIYTPPAASSGAANTAPAAAAPLDLVALVHKKLAAPWVPPQPKRSDDEWTRKLPADVQPDPADVYVPPGGQPDPFADW